MSSTGVASGAANLVEEEAVKPKGGVRPNLDKNWTTAARVAVKRRHFRY